MIVGMLVERNAPISSFLPKLLINYSENKEEGRRRRGGGKR